MNRGRPIWKQVVDDGRQGFTNFGRSIGSAFQRYGEINGEECAASFAYYAFFSLFPLILFTVAIGTFFIPDRYQAAHQVVQEVEQYVPLQAKDRQLLFTIVDDAIQNGWRAGVFGLLALLWSALRFFQALVIGVNRAWGGKSYNWWKLPLRNLLMLGILVSALVLGLVVPVIFDRLKTIYYFEINVAVDLLSNLFPEGILFFGLVMFYKFAPRRPLQFRHIWLAALLGTLFLQFGQSLFSWYLGTFTNFNALYGAFGTIMGLLLWIYYSGVVLLLGGCISATTYASNMPSRKPVQKVDLAKNDSDAFLLTSGSRPNIEQHCMAETIRGNEAPEPGSATNLRLDFEDATWLEEEAQRRRIKKEDLVKQAVNDMVGRESTGSAAYVNPEDFVAKAVHDFVARYKGERRPDR